MLNWQLIKHPLAEEYLGNSLLEEYLQHPPTMEDYKKCRKIMVPKDPNSYWLWYNENRLGIITVKGSETSSYFLLVAVFTPMENLN